MKTYDKYKPSGIDWIGDIPEHWKVVPLSKYLESIIDYRGKTPTKSESGIFLVTARNIKNGEINYSLSQEYILEEEFEKTMQRGSLEIGDVLFTTEAPLGEAANVDRTDVAVAQRVIKFRAKKDVLNNYFLKHWILSPMFQQDLMSYATGSTALGIKGSKLFHLKILLPPIDEQNAILDFISETTAQIDSVINNKLRLIELLKEERTAIINQFVTRGINPQAKLKPSGITWLGDIPEHWEVKRLKYLTKEKLKYGANESAEQENHKHPRYIRITDFGEDGKLRDDTFKSLPYEVAEDYLLEDGDILFARSGATVGKTFQFKNYEGLACYAGYLIKASPSEGKILSDFLYLFTKSGAYENWKNSIFIQATIQNIGADKYSVLEIPFPSIEEQKRIIEFIEIATSKIDATIAKIEKEIGFVREYRTALISEVITGKIRVTN